MLEPGARLESSRGSVLARWGTTFEQQSPRFDNADVSARMLLTSGSRFETGLFAAGQYDRGYLTGGPSSNERVRLQVRQCVADERISTRRRGGRLAIEHRRDRSSRRNRRVAGSGALACRSVLK